MDKDPRDPICPECRGSGVIYGSWTRDSGEWDQPEYRCWECDGSGEKWEKSARERKAYFEGVD